jgi:NLI interacting factor-like phosphatase
MPPKITKPRDDRSTTRKQQGTRPSVAGPPPQEVASLPVEEAADVAQMSPDMLLAKISDNSHRAMSVSPSPSRNQFFCTGGGGQRVDTLTDSFQRLYLVIDLDSTFVHTHTKTADYLRVMKIIDTALLSPSLSPEKKACLVELKSRIFIFSLKGCNVNMWTILRPGASEFLEFASLYFRGVYVWSAGQKEYVEQIVSILFPPHIARPSIVFHWDDCVVGSDNDEFMDMEKKEDGPNKAASPSNTQEGILFTKPLVSIFSHVRGCCSLRNTFLLDDRSDIAHHNMSNLIQIPPWEPRLTMKSLIAPENALDKLATWLMRPEVITASDVRTVDKSAIFS